MCFLTPVAPVGTTRGRPPVPVVWIGALRSHAWRGLGSLGTWLAGGVAHAPMRPVRPAGGGRTTALPAGVAALAIVRQHGWAATPGDRSPGTADRVDSPCSRLTRWTETRCAAACMEKVELSSTPTLSRIRLNCFTRQL